MIVNQRYDFSRLLDRQQYWRNEFRRELGQAVADANGLIYAYFELKADYVTPKSNVEGAISAPVASSRFFSVCFAPSDRKHENPISIEWPQAFGECYVRTERWVKNGGDKPIMPTMKDVAPTYKPGQEVAEVKAPAQAPEQPAVTVKAPAAGVRAKR